MSFSTSYRRPSPRLELDDKYSVFLRIVEWEMDQVLTVPVSAMLRVGNDWAVYRVTNGTTELHRVEIRWRNLFHAQILEGLAEDDRVTTHPSEAIADGVAIVDRGAP